MEYLTSKSIAVFAQPFTIPGLPETLPAGEYEIETELVSPPDQIDPESWIASVLVKLHPRRSHPGMARTLTISLADLERAHARDKLTGQAMTNFFLEEMLGDPMVRLVMEADRVSEVHLRHLYSGFGVPDAGKRQGGQDFRLKSDKLSSGPLLGSAHGGAKNDPRP